MGKVGRRAVSTPMPDLRPGCHQGLPPATHTSGWAAKPPTPTAMLAILAPACPKASPCSGLLVAHQQPGLPGSTGAGLGSSRPPGHMARNKLQARGPGKGQSAGGREQSHLMMVGRWKSIAVDGGTSGRWTPQLWVGGAETLRAKTTCVWPPSRGPCQGWTVQGPIKPRGETWCRPETTGIRYLRMCTCMYLKGRIGERER